MENVTVGIYPALISPDPEGADVWRTKLLLALPDNEVTPGGGAPA